MAEIANSVKTIQLKGGAAEDYKNLQEGRRKRRTRRSKTIDEVQEGGFDVPDPAGAIAMRQVNVNSARRLANASNPILTKVGGGNQAPSPYEGVKTPLTQLNASVTNTPGHTIPTPTAMHTPAINAALKVGTVPAASPLVPTPSMDGAKAPVKGGALVLAPPKKKKATGIVLAPPVTSKKFGTRSARASKRIRVQLSNMKRRITTAKLIHKDSKEKSIAEIRSLLEEAKLVKPATSGKQVPEEMLRSIYRDYLILRSKAL